MNESKKLRICVLQASYEHSNAETKDLDPPCSPARWAPHYEWVHVPINKAEAIPTVRDLVLSGKYDLFFNLCDGAWDEDRAGMEVVAALERFNAPYTGADSVFFEPSKEIMKMVAKYGGANIPAYVFAYNPEDIERACTELSLPVIVKHYNGYNSIGMTKKSRCETLEDLREQSKIMINKYGGALIEEFIEGRECTVLVSENPADTKNPIAYEPLEVRFPSGETFKHFALKWEEYDDMGWVKVKEESLRQRLMDITRRLFVDFRGRSYGRIDYRVNSKDEIYFLEINPQCGVFYPPEAPGSADQILNADGANGEGHRRFIDSLVQAALKRHSKKLQQKTCAVRFTKNGGFGLCATRDLEPGVVVWKQEEQPVHIVSRKHVERNWSKGDKKLFRMYAYPLGPGVSAMWSDKPEDWKPINHSCDPNTWLVGLDTVVRRPIKKGEELTMDYSTFCSEFMEPFNCNCGAKCCRKYITKEDCLEPGLAKIYENHVSDYVEYLQSQRTKKPSSSCCALSSTWLGALIAVVPFAIVLARSMRN